MVVPMNRGPRWAWVYILAGWVAGMLGIIAGMAMSP